MKLSKIARTSIKAVGIASLTLAFSNPASAHMLSQAEQTLSTYTLDCGYWYVGADLGLSHVHDNVTDNINVTSMNEYGPGWTAYGGYRFNALFGWELGFIDYYNSRETHVNSSGGSYQYAKTEHFAAYTAGTLRYPLAYKFNALGKLGVAYSYAKKEFVAVNTFSSEAVSLFGGLGVTYSVTKSTDLVAEWSLVRGNNYTGSTELWSLGVTFGIV
jgi:hypothetical protein